MATGYRIRLTVAPALAQAGVACAFLPPCSPELRQIEPLWHQVKYHDLTQRSVAAAHALQHAVDGVLTQRARAFHKATQEFPRPA